MKGLTIIETEILEELISEIKSLRSTVLETISELKDARSPYMTSQEVMEMIKFEKDWLSANKHKIGSSTVGGQLRFKRKDVEAYIEANYFKVKQRKANRLRQSESGDNLDK